MAKKDQDIENLSEEELTEYLNQTSDEDLTADETDNLDDVDAGDVNEYKEKSNDTYKIDVSRSIISEEMELKSPKERKIIHKAEVKEKKRLEKEKAKRSKARRKQIKKESVTILRYTADPSIGLTNDIVEERMIDGLVNKTIEKKSKPIWKIVYSNVVTFFNILVFFIAGCLIAVRAITDLTFLVIVLINIIIGIIQEIRAKKMIDSLSLINAPYAIVRRDKLNKEIPVDEVVLDDILLLENGKQICADSIVVDGQVEVNESLITGESDAIVKKPGDLLYSGSFIVSGKCAARVDKVGADNYIEKLSSQAKVYKKPKSDLLISLNRIIKFMSVPIIMIGVSLFIIMFYKNSYDITTSIRKTAGAMVGMIPSGLFLMSSIALYVGVIRLGQKNVLVQELYCIEMLARVNCICLDKTGTITDGTMVVKNVIDYNTISGLATKNIISAILNAIPDRNMTSEALIAKFGLGKRIKHTAIIPFSSQRKYQAVTFDRYGTFILGAPEFALGDHYKLVSKDVEKYAKLGYRVLCLAHKEGCITGNELPDGNIEVLSMILIEDNIRPDAIATIKYFKESGVEVRVISGDNPITVSKISERAGVPGAHNYISLDGLTDTEVVRAALKYNVFGRVTPNQKKLIIQTLKSAGKVCAMTGDGVNDILALREADCSIALGSGSEATRNCSHLVLMDSNFGSMPSVVAEGRRVINNVTSVASLFLTKTIFSLFLAIEALITGAYPISTIQLIMIDVLAIGIPSLLLVNEPNNNPVQGRFLPNVIRRALPGALVILIMSFMILIFTDIFTLDDLSANTILIIAATHTCLMVLLKACHPYTPLRKALCTFCYSVFLIAIFVLPQLLELRPLNKFFEYYSKDAEATYLADYPSVKFSAENHYIVNGIYLDVVSIGGSTSFTRSTSTNPAIYKYSINDKDIDMTFELPEVSYTGDGMIYAGGYKLNNANYSDIDNLIFNEKGILTLDNKNVTITLNKDNKYYNYSNKYGMYNEEEATYSYSILPKVTTANGHYVINGSEPEDGYFEVPINFKSIIDSDITVKINKNYELIVNGQKLYKTLKNGKTESTAYVIDTPTFTRGTDGQSLYVEAVKTERTIFEIYSATGTYEKGVDVTGYSNNMFNSVGVDASITRIDIEQGESNFKLIGDSEILTLVSLNNAFFSPAVSISKADRFVIDGYYTNYSYKTLGEAVSFSITERNGKYFLVLSNTVTDYQIPKADVRTTKGMIVSALSVNCIVVLLMLCALAAPLIKIFQYAIPWVNTQFDNIQRFLNRFQYEADEEDEKEEE